jgi:hypothetical protein
MAVGDVREGLRAQGGALRVRDRAGRHRVVSGSAGARGSSIAGYVVFCSFGVSRGGS